jgi:hypothetical protein
LSVTANFAEGSPLALDSAASNTSADDVSSISFSHTTGTGAARLMLVGVSWNSNTAGVTISSVTFTRPEARLLHYQR